jgi:hypothetical protein
LAKRIPPEDHLVRSVSWTRLRKDEDGEVVGIEPTAFELRSKEEYLSAGWLEHFAGTKEEAMTAYVSAARKSDRPPSIKSGFALGTASVIVDACLARKYRLHVVHKPSKNNASHVAVRHWPLDDLILREQMAREHWSELILAKSFYDDDQSSP